LYTASRRCSKRDKLGIYAQIERTCLTVLEFVITAQFTKGADKITFLEQARTRVEILKRLLRICQELRIISVTVYIKISELLVTISKMINGWIVYLKKLP